MSRQSKLQLETREREGVKERQEGRAKRLQGCVCVYRVLRDWIPNPINSTMETNEEKLPDRNPGRPKHSLKPKRVLLNRSYLEFCFGSQADLR